MLQIANSGSVAGTISALSCVVWRVTANETISTGQFNDNHSAYERVLAGDSKFGQVLASESY